MGAVTAELFLDDNVSDSAREMQGERSPQSPSSWVAADSPLVQQQVGEMVPTVVQANDLYQLELAKAETLLLQVQLPQMNASANANPSNTTNHANSLISDFRQVTGLNMPLFSEDKANVFFASFESLSVRMGLPAL